ncbi:poly-beta-1,6-N-acetyl-D-glucosamine N-deacetylase PgaB [Pseudomonas sp. EL_65y_Pfl2_R95]|uniref:poly-beta-1,6-N-acetyl-D-glucosamine N-deacetylase PgaB n=1 Tax=Pseudomonas sp. EL_65y_Pfl2_R95 TaxID=3088698 RepID=UPI0030D94AA7
MRYLSKIFLCGLCLILLSACASEAPPFVPPLGRTLPTSEAPWPKGQVLAICYHDIEDQEADQNYVSVRTANLIAQLNWLHDNDYIAVSIDQIIAAREGGKALPDKAILLTFDDGYSSFYDRVMPLLEAYKWPAVFAPVGAWVSTPLSSPVDFAGLPTDRRKFATWAQIKRMANNPLIEIAAHTNNMHTGALANPQGNLEPSAANRHYDPVLKRYETDQQAQARWRQDITQISAKIENATGRKPRVWVWPYGQQNGEVLNIVAQNGYSIALTLNDGMSSISTIKEGPRHLVSGDPEIGQFASSILSIRETNSMRVAHVDLDYVYDPDPTQMDKNIGTLVQRIYDLGINTVFLQAFADPEGDGTVRQTYFPNRHLPMRADLFNRASWQLQTRAHVQVYAWMPVLSFALDNRLPRVQRWDPKTGIKSVDPKQYQRLSPFNPEARKQITEIYQDLARYSNFNGLLFHDDALLSDFEDASPDALEAYGNAGLPSTIEELRNTPEILKKWTQFKTNALTNFTLELANQVKQIRGPQVLTARNIYAQPIMNPASETWYAQNLDNFLASYDWTAPMAMPLMEGIKPEDSNAWLDQMVDIISKRPGALDRTVFELQARDWSKPDSPPVASKQLAQWMTRLQWKGAVNYGYYPDDFVRNLPEVEQVRPTFSNAWMPEP